MKRQDGDVLQVQGKWGLSEWYPALRKEKLETTATPKKGRKRRRPKVSKANTAKTEADPDVSGAQPKGSASKPTPEQIEQIMKLGGLGKKPGEIAKAVGLHHFAVMGVLKSKKAA